MSPSFLLLLVLYFLIRLPWIFMVPMVEAPDEFAHYWIINFIREHWTLPSPADIEAGGPSAVYGSMPPFGYLPHIAFALIYPDNVALASRFGSLSAGVLALWSTYKSGEILFPNSRLTAFALPFLLVVHPQYIFINTYSNNDSTASALSCLSIYLSLANLQYGLKLRRTIILGIALSWLVLSKYSALCVLPIAALSIIVGGFINNHRQLIITNLLCLAGIASSITGLFFVRNYLVFGGDALGTKTMYAHWAKTFHQRTDFLMSPWHTIKSANWWNLTFQSFWGMFGYMSRLLPNAIYKGYYTLCGISLFGLLWSACSHISHGISKQNLRTIFIWLLLVLCIFGNVVAMFFASSRNLGGPQGRYLFPSELPILGLLLLGMTALPLRARKIAVIAFMGFNFFVSLFSFAMLQQLFGFRMQLF